MKNKVIYILTAALALFSSCGDSLDDTYKEYAGDGPIRYTGKCTNISVNPGWECLRAKWTPSKDPAVRNIRITWISENSDTASAEVAPTDTAYTGLPIKTTVFLCSLSLRMVPLRLTTNSHDALIPTSIRP